MLAAWRRLWPANLALGVGFTIAELALLGLDAGDPAAIDAGRAMAPGGALPLAAWCWTFA